ncbi:MAG: damage-inducible protein CinA [Dehalococcoidia bacterium]|nr:damage-inducible protein CinA [Dehalococcoidia bacterium]HCU99911.1 hypothetical protein [Dehalococcoidia bacterium]|tara:strand:- start:6028 stop:6537 length:510 start_codon:yes stop_codon:yes gene_type:complete
MSIQEHDLLAVRVGELLLNREARLAVAESTAGGLISARLISVSGASKWFERGLVAYSMSSKPDTFGVDLEFLRQHGAVSPAAVAGIAEAVRVRTGVDYVLAESGMAGPIRGRSSKPIGGVAFALAGPERTVGQEMHFEGSRVSIMEQIAEHALEMLVEDLDLGPNSALG